MSQEEQQTKALERIADALERAYPPVRIMAPPISLRPDPDLVDDSSRRGRKARRRMQEAADEYDRRHGGRG